MSAMPVEWHEECLKNAEASHDRLMEEYQRMELRVEESLQDLIRRKLQIARAKKLRKASFDAGKFGAE